MNSAGIPKLREGSQCIVDFIAEELTQIYPDIHPNQVTLITGGLSVAVAILTGRVQAPQIDENNSFLRGFALALTTFAFAGDGVDGTLARITQQSSEHGAILDSCTDRVVETSIFFKDILVAYFHKNQAAAVTALVAGITSLGPSYFRAKTESEGYNCQELASWIALPGSAFGRRAFTIVSDCFGFLLKPKHLVNLKAAGNCIIAGSNIVVSANRMRQSAKAKQKQKHGLPAEITQEAMRAGALRSKALGTLGKILVSALAVGTIAAHLRHQHQNRAP